MAAALGSVGAGALVTVGGGLSCTVVVPLLSERGLVELSQ